MKPLLRVMVVASGLVAGACAPTTAHNSLALNDAVPAARESSGGAAGHRVAGDAAGRTAYADRLDLSGPGSDFGTRGIPTPQPARDPAADSMIPTPQPPLPLPPDPRGR